MHVSRGIAVLPARSIVLLMIAVSAAARESSPKGEGTIEIPLGLTLEEATRRYVDATLDACDGNKTEAVALAVRSLALSPGFNSLGGISCSFFSGSTLF